MEKTKEVFIRLNIWDKLKQNFKSSDVLQICAPSKDCNGCCTEKDVIQTFLQRLLMMDYTARYITIKEEEDNLNSTLLVEDECDVFFSNNSSLALACEKQKHPVHPMDVQMAVFHCSDSFLKQLIVTKLSQCQYAVPLLVPNPFTKEIEFPLWTFRQIKKSWKCPANVTSKTKPICKAETPMVSFFRLGSISSSKSHLMNSLINEKHNTFFHRDCPGSSRNRLLMDGVVEIAWYCPSGKSTDHFTDCVAFCNLHGDAFTNKEQLKILTEMSTVNVVLVADPEESANKEILQKLLNDLKPLICLLSEEKSGFTGTRSGKYSIGLKERNQSNVVSELKKTIQECITKSVTKFKLKDVHRKYTFKVDENDPDCKRGKEAAKKIKRFIGGKEICVLKEEHLPHQGKLWHNWCQLEKALYRCQGNNLEMQKSKKQQEMKNIREQQHEYAHSDLMKGFISTLKSLDPNKNVYFLKWVEILFDNFTIDDLSGLHYEYNRMWTHILNLKNSTEQPDQIKNEQVELDKVSNKLNAATFGLEHILREMGQIYESAKFVQNMTKEMSVLPQLATKIIKSGFPMELMDGDAVHVPLTWIDAVLNELINEIGNKRVFVLSILGIQSSGKSTLLNAMFGLQFAVSAGRCTRGAFMQLVKVSEEMKTELKFDYILVVDTEGLRALELEGGSTCHHDNELATFVIGVGNMTLINISGENTSEMQDILQIVVQAFLRMKNVNLKPSCLFVHQNVGDITAEEKNMQGRGRLQETLDKMAKLAAKEENSIAECFSDVIAFDVKTDVQYFAQLWEGSPPMAPPNPSYSRNVQELKNIVFKKASVCQYMTLSQFKTSIGDLWNAILNENFVFSFKNTQEIAVYRKLETEFNKWAWCLRSAMLKIEENMYNRIENRKLERVEIKDLNSAMEKTKNEVRKSMHKYFEEDENKETLIQWQSRFEQNITQLLDELVNDAKRELNEVIQQQKARETFESKKKEYDKKLFDLSEKLAMTLKSNETNEEVLMNEFNKLWEKWVSELTQGIPLQKNFDSWEDAKQIISAGNEHISLSKRLAKKHYKKIDQLGSYSKYIILNNQRRTGEKSHHTKESDLYTEDHISVRSLAIKIIQKTESLINSMRIEKLGYKESFIKEITDSVKKRVNRYASLNKRIHFKNTFLVDLCLHVCDFAHHRFTELHKKFRDATDPRVYLEKQKPQYYNVFRNYCRGATTTAVFGELICNNLESSILEAVYNKTAIDLASQMRSDMPEFNGNRSNLEKHILKSLAEEENFDEYIKYILNPKKHFKDFIAKKVTGYISHNTMFLDIFKRNLKDKEQSIVNTVHTSTEETKNSCGDADTWLKCFSHLLTDEFNIKEITCIDLKEIKDFNFLKKVVIDGVKKIILKLHRCFNNVADIKMENFRKRPDEILTDYLCHCCWAQCPFCNAICTNTINGHTGDHSVPFHRINGIIGCYSRGTPDLCADFCTTNVQTEKWFSPRGATDEAVPYKQYRKAGGEYAIWSITPDNSELQYWKWFVCRFQGDLEKHYGKSFRGSGEIPSGWRKYTKEQAIKSLDEYI